MFPAQSILLNTFGTAGDVFPYLAMGKELVSRGHRVALASDVEWAGAAHEAGLEFIDFGPHIGGDQATAVWRRKMANEPEAKRDWLLEVVLGRLPAQVRDARKVLDGFGAVVLHPLAWAMRIAARSVEKPWVSTVLEPGGFFSQHEPLVSPVPFSESIALFGALSAGSTRTQMERALAPLNQLILEASSQFGCGLWSGDPLLEGQFSPHLNLALLSRTMAVPQSDWPRHTVVSGFCAWETSLTSEDHETLSWVREGQPPIVMSLGDIASQRTDGVPAMVHEACVNAGRRLLIVGGVQPEDTQRFRFGHVRAVTTAPLRQVLEQSALFVHGGSIGLCGMALSTGIPSLILPFSAAEEDHAARVAAEECAVVLPRKRATLDRVFDTIQDAIRDEELRGYARVLRAHYRYESGPMVAADCLECLLVGSEMEKRIAKPSIPLSRARLRQMWLERTQSQAA